MKARNWPWVVLGFAVGALATGGLFLWLHPGAVGAHKEITTNEFSPARHSHGPGASDAEQAVESWPLPKVLAALEPLAKVSIDSNSLDATYELVKRVATVDIAQVMQAVDRMAPGGTLAYFRMGLLARWTDWDPQRAMGYAQSAPIWADKVTRLRTVLGSWLEKDADSASRWVVELKPSPLRNLSMEVLVSTLSDQNPQSALKVAQSVESSVIRDSLVGTVFSHWANAKPADAAVGVTELTPSGSQRQTAERVVAGVWVWKDPAATIAWAQGLSDPDRMVALTAAVAAWARADPVTAGGFARSLEDPAARHGLVAVVLTEWAAIDLHSALTWMQGLPDKDEKVRGAGVLLPIWYETDPAAVAAYASTLPGSETRNALIQNIALKVAETNPLGAVNWVRSFPPDSLRDSVFNAVIYAISTANPRAASEVISTLPVGDERDRALITLTMNWSAQDPRSAAAYVLALGPGGMQDRLLADVTANWAKGNLEDTVGWVMTLTDPNLRKVALSGMATTWSAQDPRAALVFSQSLPAGPDRDALAAR